MIDFNAKLAQAVRRPWPHIHQTHTRTKWTGLARGRRPRMDTHTRRGRLECKAAPPLGTAPAPVNLQFLHDSLGSEPVEDLPREGVELGARRLGAAVERRAPPRAQRAARAGAHLPRTLGLGLAVRVWVRVRVRVRVRVSTCLGRRPSRPHRKGRGSRTPTAAAAAVVGRPG